MGTQGQNVKGYTRRARGSVTRLELPEDPHAERFDWRRAGMLFAVMSIGVCFWVGLIVIVDLILGVLR